VVTFAARAGAARALTQQVARPGDRRRLSWRVRPPRGEVVDPAPALPTVDHECARLRRRMVVDMDLVMQAADVAGRIDGFDAHLVRPVRELGRVEPKAARNHVDAGTGTQEVAANPI